MNPQVVTDQVMMDETTNPCPPLSSDASLLQACRVGDYEAWQHLLEKYECLVYKVPLHYGLPPAEAVGVAQIVFTALLQSLETWQDESNLSRWLTLVARRHAWRALRCRESTPSAALSPDPLAALAATYLSKNVSAQALLPSAVHDLLLQRFVDYVQCREQSDLFPRRPVILTLTPLPQSAPAGLRAGVSEPTYHYVYTNRLLDVTLNVQPGRGGPCYHLIGQIFANVAQITTMPVVVQLVQREQEVAITLTDVVGGFWFEALTPGVYDLCFSTDSLEIELLKFVLAPCEYQAHS